MIIYPILNRIKTGEVTAEEARAGLRQLLDEQGLKVYTHVFSALRVWTVKVLTSGRTDATELNRWFRLLRGVSVTMARREPDCHDSVAVDVLAEVLFDYLSKLMRDAFDAADSFHYQYLVHRRLGRFMVKPGNPIDFTRMQVPGEMSWSVKGDQSIEFIHVRRPETEDKGRFAISREWFERKVALEGDTEIGAGFDMIHMLQEDDVTQVSLIQTLRDLHDAFAPWAAQTVKQEQAIAAAKALLDRYDLDAYATEKDISSESREIITDIFGSAVLVSDRPIVFTLEEVDTILKVQRALLGKPSFEDALIESIREFADQVLSAGQDCCIDPDAGPDATTTVRFTGEEGCRMGDALHRMVNAVAPVDSQ
ncbi:hypothetical protein CcrColossus_gp389 [Caulobacter phage CcrColossus]|uniref:Uncharacterized protein n=1 Tax=Caulobacter phage CcrColossus TaxID=1211640 RepID=K4JSD0_9CAUD|nr:hypothetical protein CcrColossus_gp389 [Caulobacter phage CcrColossus]AFU88259.1 hypothetical protein CcrColossus_gp389 [Caulobacter phage CcrColossus]